MTTIADLFREQYGDRETFYHAVMRSLTPLERDYIRLRYADEPATLVEVERLWAELDAGTYDDSCTACGGRGCPACDGSGKQP
jgi:hypothetical protein